MCSKNGEISGLFFLKSRVKLFTSLDDSQVSFADDDDDDDDDDNDDDDDDEDVMIMTWFKQQRKQTTGGQAGQNYFFGS